MSKAKELAFEALEIFNWVTASNQDMSAYKKLTKLHDLAHELLDEPEPLKGFVEIEYRNSPTEFLPINQIVVKDWGHGKCSVVPISFLNSERYNANEFMTVESYDEIKQKIARAG